MSNLEARILAEWHRLTDAIIHRPGVEMLFGILSPFPFLYEREFKFSLALEQHVHFERALVENGVRVIRLKDTVVSLMKKETKMFEKIRDFAISTVKFRGNKEIVSKARKEFYSASENFDEETIFNILILQPSFFLQKSSRYKTTLPRVVLEVPLANLFFMRDQQVVTDLGIVIGRLAKPQRRFETVLTGTLLNLMGLNIVHYIREPGTLEGGDFMPAEKISFIGTGERTNIEGVKQLMKKGLGFDEVALVSQPSHPLIPENLTDPMINMHLDTYFNLAGEKIVVGSPLLLKNASTTIYKRKSRGYYKRVEKTTLYDFLKIRGFQIIGITTLEQMCYASNFLCLKEGHILAVESEDICPRAIRKLELKATLNPARYGMLLEQVKKDYHELNKKSNFFPYKEDMFKAGIKVQPIKLEDITGGYGGAHCMTASISRH